jgi:preprotein translocase subunit YajC
MKMIIMLIRRAYPHLRIYIYFLILIYNFFLLNIFYFFFIFNKKKKKKKKTKKKKLCNTLRIQGECMGRVMN